MSDGRRSRGIARARIALLLLPALAVVVLLFGGGLIDALVQSLGYLPAAGLRALNLDAYRAVLGAPAFLQSLLLTLYIAGASTLIATALGLATALMLRRNRSRRMMAVLQLPLAVPYLAAAVGVVLVIGQTGLIARLAAVSGLIDEPREFPPLVYDRYAIGIILTYVWKETPFITLVVLALLRGMTEELEDAARTLGAGRWQRFRHVTLPRILPGISAAALLVFAFSFGAFEVPFLLGRTWPQTLPVLAWNEYRSIDLTHRPAAMAIALVIAVLTGALTLLCLRAARRLYRA